MVGEISVTCGTSGRSQLGIRVTGMLLGLSCVLLLLWCKCRQSMSHSGQFVSHRSIQKPKAQ
ncbi:uncharacterized protein BDV17DRAFT_234776 [Aspergillus undulatus]|uniref:uncharacterized protein n=1 Tax=Aspergillus undulatus TaxID=1810928 RepID=UPI003CCD5088